MIFARVDLRVIVDVEDADGGGRQKRQAGEVGAAFVEVVDVRQDARRRELPHSTATRSASPSRRSVFEKPQTSDDRRHAHLLPKVEQRAVAVGGRDQIDDWLGKVRVVALAHAAGGADGRRRDVRPNRSPRPSPCRVSRAPVLSCAGRRPRRSTRRNR